MYYLESEGRRIRGKNSILNHFYYEIERLDVEQLIDNQEDEELLSVYNIKREKRRNGERRTRKENQSFEDVGLSCLQS